MKLLMNLIFEPKGKHDPALAYNIKDTVMSADGSQVYFALQDVPAGTALDNEDYWKLQIDMHDTLVKLDILGHVDPTVIRACRRIQSGW